MAECLVSKDEDADGDEDGAEREAQGEVPDAAGI